MIRRGEQKSMYRDYEFKDRLMDSSQEAEIKSSNMKKC